MPLKQANQDLYIVKKPLDEDRMLPTNKKIIHVRLSGYSQAQELSLRDNSFGTDNDDFEESNSSSSSSCPSKDLFQR